MIGRNNHLVSINDVEIEKLLDFAYSIEFNLYEKLSCEGKILANYFMNQVLEPQVVLLVQCIGWGEM